MTTLHETIERVKSNRDHCYPSMSGMTVAIRRPETHPNQRLPPIPGNRQSLPGPGDQHFRITSTPPLINV